MSIARSELNQTKTRWSDIVAAPKILRIRLDIVLDQQKIFHTLQYPENLDLTTHQQNATLPLRYRLSSVVAHNGDFYDPDELDRKKLEELVASWDKQEKEQLSLKKAKELQAQLMLGRNDVKDKLVSKTVGAAARKEVKMGK